MPDKQTSSLVERWVADDRGLNTAELLGNAALAIIALIAIWGALQVAGVDLVNELMERVRDGFGG